MDTDRSMYNWRRMTQEQRKEALTYRQRNRLPWHGPPHYVGESSLYLVSAACFEHRHVIGASPRRMAEFEYELLEAVPPQAREAFAWVVLPNHYHLLVDAPDIHGLLGALGRLHGRTSFHWNGEDALRGRQVWHRAAETAIKSEAHFWATLNYVLHNPVHHGYAERWEDWPYSSASEYLADVGRDEARRRWRRYPLFDYGESWDPPDL